jgi:hypothetical protein
VATASLFGNWLSALVGAGILIFTPFWLIFGHRGEGIIKSRGTGVDSNA